MTNKNVSQEEIIQNAVTLSSRIPEINYGNYRECDESELRILSEIVGLKFIEIHNQHGLGIYIDDRFLDRRSFHYYPQSKYFIENLGITPINYLRTDYGVIFQDRFIMITTHQKVDHFFNKELPPKVVQVDFMFLEDYESDENCNISYRKVRELKRLDQNRIDASAITLFRFLREIVQSVPLTTIIRVVYSDEQRARLYKKALKDQQNVIFTDSHR